MSCLRLVATGNRKPVIQVGDGEKEELFVPCQPLQVVSHVALVNNGKYPQGVFLFPFHGVLCSVVLHTGLQQQFNATTAGV